MPLDGFGLRRLGRRCVTRIVSIPQGESESDTARSSSSSGFSTAMRRWAAPPCQRHGEHSDASEQRCGQPRHARSLPESPQYCACIFGIGAARKALEILLEQAPSLARVTAGRFQTAARVERVLRPGIPPLSTLP